MIVLVINIQFFLFSSSMILVNDPVITDDPSSNCYNYLGSKYVQCIYVTKS